MNKKALRKIEILKSSILATPGYVRTKFGKHIPDWFVAKVSSSNPFEN